MALLDTGELAYALSGVSYPARRWQMATQADLKCASSQVREALRHIPDHEYASLLHLTEVLADINRRACSLT